MVLTGLVALKAVGDLQLAQLSTAALARAVGIDPKARNDETLSLLLFLGLREDTVLAQAMTMVAADPEATSALVATAAAWRVLAEPTIFPARLERHGDFGILVSTDGKVRVAVCLPAGFGNRILRVSFASPSTFYTSVIVSSHHLVTDGGCSAREILFGGNFLVLVFHVLATIPNCADHLRRLLTRAIASYEGLVYDVVRPPLATPSRVAGSVLVPFGAMLGGMLSPPLELVFASPPRDEPSKTLDDALFLNMSSYEGSLRETLRTALENNAMLLQRLHEADEARQHANARIAELEAERDHLMQNLPSKDATGPPAAFAPSRRIDSQRRASLPSSMRSTAAIVQPQRRVSLPPPTPARPGASTPYRPRAALLRAVRPLPARRMPPHAPGPDVGQHASSAFLTPGALMVTQFNSMSPDARLAFERRVASPQLLYQYPSPAHSSPFVPESPPFDLSTPPYPPYVSPSSPSSFASTRLVFDAMTQPQTERRSSPPPTEDDSELADRALNMSVDEINNDDNENDAIDA